MDKTKIIVDIPKKLDNRLIAVTDKQMLTKTAVVILALTNYCEKILNNNGSD